MQAFTYPFCYTADPCIVQAAGVLSDRIRRDPVLDSIFREGKMLGILLAADKNGQDIYLYAFSGLAAGRSHIEGFVPPVFDLTAPEGFFKTKEKELSELNEKIRKLKEANEEERKKESGETDGAEKDKPSEAEKDKPSKAERNRPSEAEKNAEIQGLKELRKRMSADLQDWIFEKYVVLNARGERKSVKDIFSGRGLIPPGGSGDCAAPKLLQYAYLHDMKPLAMGEFWYGASPVKELRLHGRFYPSCIGKCGPLLSYMLEGLTVEANPLDEDKSWLDLEGKQSEPRIIYEDDCIIVADKPSGMLSVPGRNGKKKSLQEWLQKHSGGEIYACHRLDMDTSGLIVFAKNTEAQAAVQNQFATQGVRKTYIARLSATAQGKVLKKGFKGTIALPIILDYYDRPRQMVDFENGKKAVTEYEILDLLPGGEVDVRFTPLTGRTHQLRVHSAHPCGLGRPILGDRLYGGMADGCGRLCLHAETLALSHPASGEEMVFKS